MILHGIFGLHSMLVSKQLNSSTHSMVQFPVLAEQDILLSLQFSSIHAMYSDDERTTLLIEITFKYIIKQISLEDITYKVTEGLITRTFSLSTRVKLK